MNLLRRLLNAWARLIRLPARVVGLPRWLLAVLALLLLAAALGALVFYGSRWLPARFWQLAALCGVALAVLWWFIVGAKRVSRRGFTRKHLGDLTPGDVQQEQPALDAMRQAIRDARQTIRRSPEMAKGRDPLYRIPWVLFIGDADARVDNLLQAASQASPFPAPARSDSALWHWWFFRQMIAIEAAPLVVCDQDAKRERGLWYHALLQLSQEREHLPLNGMAVCISARTLLAGPQAVRPTAMRLRRLVDEALEHLQLQMPMYLIVTGLEQLPGYEAFTALLPEQALQQALGHSLAPQQAVSAATAGSLDAFFTPIAERLHALQLTAQRQQHDAKGRHQLFAFACEFRALQPGLHSLLQMMLEDNPFQRTPRWRGLYFTAAPASAGGGAARPGFVADLFTRFLPADQPLATTNLKGHAGKLGVAAVGVAAMLGFSALLSHSLQGVHQDDSSLQAAARLACLEPADAGAASRVAWVARCGRTVEQLESAQAATGLGFGLRRADASIAHTRDVLLRDFSSLILAPYDQIIESDLARGQTSAEHVLAVTQRLRLLRHCRKRNPECHAVELAHNAAFDPRARIFSPFVSGEQGGGSAQDHAHALFTTYLGYLRWQSPSVLDAEAQRLETLLAQLQRASPLTIEGLQRWADARLDGLQLQDFWLPEGRVVGVESDALPRLSAIYTAPVWQGFVRPTLEQLAAHADTSSQREALQALRQHYLTASQQAWGAFAAQFHHGLPLWRGAADQLLPIAANAQHNPYSRLETAIDQQLLALPLQLPSSTQWALARHEASQRWWMAWRPMGRFAGQWVAATSNGLTSPWWTERRAPAAPWLAAWLETRSQLQARAPTNAMARAYLQLAQADDGAPLYQTMAALFRSTTSDSAAAPLALPAAQDYALLLKTIEAPAAHYATRFTPADQQAWAVAQGPVQLLLHLAMQRSATYLQARWQDSVVAPLQNLDAREQLERLYGANGRLASFTQDWLEPFVSGAERAPRQLAGVSLPLAPAFAALLGAGQHYQPRDDSKPFAAATLQFHGPSQFGQRTEGIAGTELEVVCQERSYRVNSQGESLADGRVQVFWSPTSCPQVRMRIALPDPPAPAPVDPPTEGSEAPAGAAAVPAPAPVDPANAPRLTLVYQGNDSLPALLRDFSSGVRTLRLTDFRDSYTPAQWSRLQPVLAQAGLTQVRVFLHATPTPEMERHLAGGPAPAALPQSIFSL